MNWTVLCDFDHTITTEDVTDTLLERHALKEWKNIEALWEKGQIGSRACMQQQIALLRATPTQVQAVADSIHIDPSFKSFAGLCAANKVPLIIVSDGLDYVIERVLQRNGLSHLHVIASHLSPTGGDRWELTAPFANTACSSQASTCKCAMSRQLRTLTGANKMLYIGDGRSDFCVSMEEADLIFAKDSLLAYCRKQELAHQPFNNFAQAASMLEKVLIEHEVVVPASIEEVVYA